MATGRRPIVLISGVKNALLASDYVLGAGDLFNGITQYQRGQTRTYVATGTTDANGRITVFPTTTGLITGTALFSSIFFACAHSSASDATAVNNAFYTVDSINAGRTQIVFRGVVGVTSFISVGINVSTLVFAPAGKTAYIKIIGLP